MSLEFIDLYKEVMERTPLTPDRVWHLWRLARVCKPIPGDMAECGCFKGGSARIISKAIHGKKRLHLFDTFTGIPAEQRLDGEHSAGDFGCSLTEVMNFLQDCQKIKYYPGLVPETLEENVDNIKFSFVYLDMDIYIPTLAALQFFWKRLSPGGIIVLDDVDNLFGIGKAINEFVTNSDSRIDIIRTTIDQAALIKV